MAIAYKIGEAAALLNLKTYVLRFWETEFPHIVPLRTEKGQRLYTEENLALLERIRFLLHERGLTIEGARKVLNEDREKGVSYVFTAGADLYAALTDEAPQAVGLGKKAAADEEPCDPEEEHAQAADAEDTDPDAGDSVVEKFLSQYNLPGINKSYPIHERSLFERRDQPDRNEPPAVRRRKLFPGAVSRLTTDTDNDAGESARSQGAAQAVLQSLAVELEAIVLLLRHG